VDEQRRRARTIALHVKSRVSSLYEPRINAHLVLHLVEECMPHQMHIVA
jgi:hypothetical protein